MIGSTVDQYQIVQSLGKSAVTETYLAVGTQNGKQFVLKAINQELLRQPDFRKRLFDDASALVKFEHPNCAGLGNLLEEGGRIFTVREYFPGRTLQACMAEGGLARDNAVSLFKDLVRGVGYAHSQGRVHRFLNPESLIVKSDGQGVVIGLDYVLNDEKERRLNEAAMTKIGRYFAPERFANPQTTDIRANVYSMGVVLYEMLCGRPPFESAEYEELWRMHEQDQPTDPLELDPGIPRALAQVALHAIAKSGESRFPNAVELYKALERSLQGADAWLASGAVVSGAAAGLGMAAAGSDFGTSGDDDLGFDFGGDDFAADQDGGGFDFDSEDGGIPITDDPAPEMSPAWEFEGPSDPTDIDDPFGSGSHDAQQALDHDLDQDSDESFDFGTHDDSAFDLAADVPPSASSQDDDSFSFSSSEPDPQPAMGGFDFGSPDSDPEPQASSSGFDFGGGGSGSSDGFDFDSDPQSSASNDFGFGEEPEESDTDFSFGNDNSFERGEPDNVSVEDMAAEMGLDYAGGTNFNAVDSSESSASSFDFPSEKPSASGPDPDDTASGGEDDMSFDFGSDADEDAFDLGSEPGGRRDHEQLPSSGSMPETDASYDFGADLRSEEEVRSMDFGKGETSSSFNLDEPGSDQNDFSFDLSPTGPNAPDSGDNDPFGFGSDSPTEQPAPSGSGDEFGFGGGDEDDFSFDKGPSTSQNEDFTFSQGAPSSGSDDFNFGSESDSDDDPFAAPASSDNDDFSDAFAAPSSAADDFDFGSSSNDDFDFGSSSEDDFGFGGGSGSSPEMDFGDEGLTQPIDDFQQESAKAAAGSGGDDPFADFGDGDFGDDFAAPNEEKTAVLAGDLPRDVASDQLQTDDGAFSFESEDEPPPTPKQGLEDSLAKAEKGPSKTGKTEVVTVRRVKKLDPKILMFTAVLVLTIAGGVGYWLMDRSQKKREEKLVNEVQMLLENDEFEQVLTRSAEISRQGLSSGPEKRLSGIVERAQKEMAEIRKQIANLKERAVRFEQEGNILSDGKTDAYGSYGQILAFDAADEEARERVKEIKEEYLGKVDERLAANEELEALRLLSALSKGDSGDGELRSRYNELRKKLKTEASGQLREKIQAGIIEGKLLETVPFFLELKEIESGSGEVEKLGERLYDALRNEGRDHHGRDRFDYAERFYLAALEVREGDPKMKEYLDELKEDILRSKVRNLVTQIERSSSNNNYESQYRIANELLEVDPGNQTATAALEAVNKYVEGVQASAEENRRRGAFDLAADQYKIIYDINGDGNARTLWQKYSKWAPPKGMAFVPLGPFRMGSNTVREAKPEHNVHVSSFFIDTYEVTNREYKEFVDANPQWHPDRIDPSMHDGNYLKHWKNGNPPASDLDRPVVFVSWFAAKAFAVWKGKRLPTEAEWEKAARGNNPGEKFWWGKYPDAKQAVYEFYPEKKPAPVGSFPANAYGVYEILGNVNEWVEDTYSPDFYEDSDNVEDPLNNAPGGAKVFRGGSYRSRGRDLAVYLRYAKEPTFCHPTIGFRCAKDAQVEL